MVLAAAAAVEPLQPGALALAAEAARSSPWASAASQLLPPESAAAALQAAADSAEKGPTEAEAEAEAGAAKTAPVNSDDVAGETEKASGGEAHPDPVAAVVVQIEGQDGGPPAAAAGTAGAESSASTVAAAAVAEAPAIDRPSSEAAARAASSAWLSFLALLDHAGLGAPQLRPGLHMLLAIAAAGTLYVVRPVLTAFDGKSVWVLYTGGRTAGKALLGGAGAARYDLVALNVACGLAVRGPASCRCCKCCCLLPTARWKLARCRRARRCTWRTQSPLCSSAAWATCCRAASTAPSAPPWASAGRSLRLP